MSIVRALVKISSRAPASAYRAYSWRTSQRAFASQANASKLRESLSDPSLFKENAYIDGKWIASKSGRTFDVVDPATGKIIGTCPEMTGNETATAINVAQRAFHDFQHTTARQRMDILKRWFELMNKHKNDLAKILMFENGRPASAAGAEITYAASFFEWFQGEAVRNYGDTIQGSAAGNRVLTLKLPIGVVGILTPWNFPCAMITRKVGAAVAAGCTVVLKPAAETPYSALALAELGERAGLPKGVFNIVTTHENVSEVGKELCENNVVKKISFTGSTGVGKTLMAQSSSSLKKLSLELGGNAPFIIFNDAQIESAVAGLMAAKFRASGQTCVCANRIYVQSKIYDSFIAAFAAEVERSMISGASEDPRTSLGCLINAKAVQKVERLVKDATEHGAEVVIGGKKAGHEMDTFYPPTILKNMKPTMQAFSEEIFGPVVSFFKFETEDEVLALANNADVGLASYVYTENLPVAWRMAEALQTGMTGINIGVISDAVAPFGGIKHSGFGREGGRVGLDEFQIMKTITIGGLGIPESKLSSI
ncbi:succinate-semialdehyde dehydrogenase-like protein [Coleophoma cylindrospora]|uniref:succinate-semialdehyde dehydrogenase [NAD(P)(+)] n=1 Tax=Coleophoma cylindrospora TaxID=1849047 RepID=A0A3D8QKZ0_9HELO|nr:succinate-semialdehyde dehydrogenase-like protein [Coleophoma cylindrospora]